MAKSMIPPRTTTTRREILDVDGTPLTSPGSLGVSEKAGPDGAGGMQNEKTLVSIVTVDGLVYHSGMDLKLVVCTCCRRGLEGSWLREAEQPTHGLCAEINAVRCSSPGCGAWCCPRHARQVDGHWLCRDCATRWGWKRWLWNLYSRIVED